ncbi:exodeoxyribonuclease [Gordonia araii NBRC 100433]|uniref:Exodeoxyribonuclease n=1 Tax=Gordonia araii NBRC 100433 TaxID=1073574 RepID=G7GZW0_9ACTN|nr:exodeoxyribonuclease III [Gordonia araii]NNG98750.1 exodeoxyribonuclease III [Gordonia araii NBRC 100433]GAB09135.1 exodeoxyribonuclease [Gordonia araii NBRC 100433]
MSISVTTVNVNGIRAAVKERSAENLGLLPWLAELESEAVALQEIRATEEQAREALAPAIDDGWHLTMSESTVKGHAGVGVLTRAEPTAVRAGFGSDEFDTLGRYVEVDVPTSLGEVTVASLYLPKGAVDPAHTSTATETDERKFAEKKRFLAEFGGYLSEKAATGRHAVVGGDWNIAPTENDLKAFKTNRRSPGFLPHEREWVAALLDDGWVDVTRTLTGDVPGPYTWWSWRGKSFDNDAGWRIDYHLATPELAERAVKSYVHRPEAYDLRWSDHSAVTTVFEGSDD